MSSSPLRALEAAARLLPRAEREELVKSLLASLDEDPDVESAWAEEIERRVAMFAAGRYDEYDAAQVLMEARERIGR